MKLDDHPLFENKTTASTRSKKFETDSGYNKPTAEDIKVDLNELDVDVSDTDTVRQIINSVAKGAGTVINVHERIKVINEERNQKKREHYRRKLANETEDQRAQRLASKSQMTRERRDRKRANESEEQRAERLAKQNQMKRVIRQREIEILRHCSICSRDFMRKSDLTKHYKTIHPEIYPGPDLPNNNNNSGEICEVCGKIFVTSYRLKIHSIIHKEKIYTCSFENCTKSFAFKCYLSKHISSFHSSTSPSVGQPRPKIHLCDICGQNYSRLDGYKYHKERHSRILAMRKEAYEVKLRGENPSKSDQEFGEFLQKFWESKESMSLVTAAPETYEEIKAIRKQDFIEKIKKLGLQRYGESAEECQARINKERLEKIWKKREAETEEERQRRRERYLRGFKKYVQKNKKKYSERLREYQKNRIKEKMKTTPEFRAKSLAYQRARWAKMTPEQKAMRLESMRDYQKQRKRKPHD